MITTMEQVNEMIPTAKRRRVDEALDRHETAESNKEKQVEPPKCYVSLLVLKMEECLGNLGIKDVDMAELERMSVMIYESMSISSRDYHSVQHVFDISNDMTKPIPILSALFHDCVYFHVDKRLTTAQEELLQGTYTADERGNLEFKASSEDYDDELLKLVEFLFSFKPGQKLEKGLNEFLSALIAVRCLKKFLPMHQLAEIACCIEATIPFRPANPETKLQPTEHLFSRLLEANKKFKLEMKDDEMEQAIHKAVKVAGNDVQNFASTDVYDFLDGTWSLLPEQNENLRMQYCITAMDLQRALNGMYGFFNLYLKPENVFDEFRGVPSQKEMDWKLELCKRNVCIAKKYVGAKLYAMSVVAAFACLTGGDGPLSLFLGDLKSNKSLLQHTNFDDFLPECTLDQLKKCDKVVYHILKEGRKAETQFDTKQSPISAYLYSILGDERLTEILNTVELLPMEEENAWLILKALPIEALETLSNALKNIALSRTKKFEKLMERLREEMK
mmetsp:Transcript_19621/g.48258  ORF Transcript_19621/g.48258 Transcript_19621/m.48258 type:complete len:504 (-) Transcript_19621:86-1597(-)